MKGFRKIIGSALMAAALAFGMAPALPAHAQTIPTFTSGFQVQNLASTTATVDIAFYAENNGTAAVSRQVQIDPNGQKTYATLDTLGVGTNFSGSAVLSSDQKIAAIVNLISPNLPSISLGSSYVGASGGSLEVSLPLIFKSYFGFNTYFHVQNVGSGTANVTINYSGTIGTTGTPFTGSEGPFQIPANAARRFDQSQLAAMPAGFNGSATVVSTGSEVAAVVNQVGPTTSLTYNGFSAGSTNPVFPLINSNNFGYVTGIALQNRDNTDSQVTVTYTKAGGTSPDATCTETQTIPANSTRYFALDAFAKTVAGETCTNGTPTGSGTNSFFGSARVTGNSANVELVAIVNQLNQTTRKGGSYAAFDPNNATDSVVFPLIQDRFFSYNTGISIINAGDVAVTITCNYSGSVYTSNPPTAFQRSIQSPSIPAGGAYTVPQQNTIADRFNGSGVCSADNTSAKLIGVANQLNNGTSVDTFFVYEGTNN